MIFQFRSNIGQRNTGDRQRSKGVYSEEKTKSSKEATLSYQQELQQQVLSDKASNSSLLYFLAYNGCKYRTLSDNFM